jgi:hypothetical protein
MRSSNRAVPNLIETRNQLYPERYPETARADASLGGWQSAARGYERRQSASGRNTDEERGHFAVAALRHGMSGVSGCRGPGRISENAQRPVYPEIAMNVSRWANSPHIRVISRLHWHRAVARWETARPLLVTLQTLLLDTI